MGKEVHRERIDALLLSSRSEIFISVIIQTAVHSNHLLSQCYWAQEYFWSHLILDPESRMEFQGLPLHQLGCLADPTLEVSHSVRLEHKIWSNWIRNRTRCWTCIVIVSNCEPFWMGIISKLYRLYQKWIIRISMTVRERFSLKLLCIFQPAIEECIKAGESHYHFPPCL